ncbi:Ku protein [Streptomyces bottropensis]
MMSADELADMPLPTAKAIEILGFVPYESIDPIRIGAGYFLEADGQVAGKPYVLLRREWLGLLRTGGDHLFLACGIPCAQALRRCGQG